HHTLTARHLPVTPLLPYTTLFRSNTVLPTPAPPNKPILPPLAYGSSRSITLIPVNNTSVSVDNSSNLGGSLWIGRPFVVSKSWITSMAPPTTLNTRPLIS